MTREEAIKVINNHLEHWKRLVKGKVCDETEGAETISAFEVAIKALEQNESAEEWYKLFVKKLDEQEPCTDAISRKAVMEIIKAHMDGEDKNTKAVLSDVMESVNELEILEQEPCTDAVSREAVYQLLMNMASSAYGFEEIRRIVDKLPSVTPKPIECDDAISRDEVMSLFKTYWRCFVNHENMELFKGVIQELPSVTQKGDEKNV